MPRVKRQYLDSIIEGAGKLKELLLTPAGDREGQEETEGDFFKEVIEGIEELDSDLWALIDFIESGDYKEFLEPEGGGK